MVADFIWLSYHPIDSWPICQDAMIQIGMCQGQVSTGSAERELTEGLLLQRPLRTPSFLLPHPSPLSPGVSGIVWAIVKGLGMEGPSCQYLKIAIGGNVVVDDLFSRETEAMSEHPSSVQRGCPLSSCWINGQKSNDRFQLQPLID